jgi:hypothetical protein
MIKIYVLHPGKIRRRTGVIEYFSSDELASLYDVAQSECMIYQPTRKYEDSEGIKYIHLRPRDDDNYNIK